MRRQVSISYLCAVFALLFCICTYASGLCEPVCICTYVCMYVHTVHTLEVKNRGHNGTSCD